MYLKPSGPPFAQFARNRSGRRVGRMSLGELAQRVGCDYTTIGKAVSRFGQRLRKDKSLAKAMAKLERQS